MSVSNSLPTSYQQIIHKSRYARWLDEEGRRENWYETVERYVSFMEKALLEKHDYKLSEGDKVIITEYITNLSVMPSMRALMTAGEALERDNVCGYNCSYLPVDSPRSFDEAMYILMCGTGVGFSWGGPWETNVDAVFSRRIGRNPNPQASGSDQDGSFKENRFWFSLSRSF